MDIPLNEFEQVINETILKRGVSYYNKGYVTDFAELATGEYEAIVTGTMEYVVNLHIKNNMVVAYYCSCPYDRGPVCKHIVAAILFLKQDELDLNQHQPKRKKRKPVAQQLQEVIQKIAPEELQEFVKQQAKVDKQFKNLFLAYFAHLHESQSKEFYQDQIRSIVNSATDNYGFIGWHEMAYLEQGIAPIISMAENHFENGNYQSAVSILTALLEEINKAIEFSDDSNGVLGGIIENAYEMLHAIARKDLPDTVRVAYFNYCISSFAQRLFDGWDWHLDILSIASELANNESEGDIIIKHLDTINGDYERKRAEMLKLSLLTKYKPKKDVQEFIEKHIANSLIRNKEIARAVESKEFARAIKLCQDGIAYDARDKPGLVKDWYNWLLEIAQIQNDKVKIIEYARFLFIDNFMPKQDYYAILKQNVEPAEWQDFLEQIIKEISARGGWLYEGLVRRIYIEEKWWDRLFMLLKEDASLSNIENNEKYLAKDYAGELIQLYRDRIIEYLAGVKARKHYQEACRYLRRMKKLGGTKEVNKLLAYFREAYPKRKALLEELNKV